MPIITPKLTRKTDLTENRIFSSTVFLNVVLKDIGLKLPLSRDNNRFPYKTSMEMDSDFCACCGKRIYPWSNSELCESCEKRTNVSTPISTSKEIPWSVPKIDYADKAKDIFNLR